VRRTALAALALAVLACNDPREAELAQELVALQEARTPKRSFELMRAEAEAGAEGVRALEGEVEGLRAQVADAKAATAGVEAAYQGEVDRNGVLNREIEAGQKRLQDAAARQAALEQEIAIARARAETFQDQAAIFAKELRPEDPEWARNLRIRSLREFLDSVGATWPRDPVLAEAAKRPLPSDATEATRVGAELAARIRDRVAEVYGLEARSGAAAEPPAVAAEPGNS
jgi:chromosome segregation ATPase